MSCELHGVEWRSILPTKLVATATSLERSIKITSDGSSPGKFCQSCKFREDRSGTYVEITGLAETTKNIIFKKMKTAAKH